MRRTPRLTWLDTGRERVPVHPDRRSADRGAATDRRLVRDAPRAARRGSFRSAARRVRTIIRDGALTAAAASARARANVRVCATNRRCPARPCARRTSTTAPNVAAASPASWCTARAWRTTPASRGDVCRHRDAHRRVRQTRAVDHRTGVDCASCKAKLGTPRVGARLRRGAVRRVRRPVERPLPLRRAVRGAGSSGVPRPRRARGSRAEPRAPAGERIRARASRCR